jgi:hypothetical protein
MTDSYADIRTATVPILLTGFLVGTSASDDRLWGLYGMTIGFGVWGVWVVSAIAVRAWHRTREARR